MPLTLAAAEPSQMCRVLMYNGHAVRLDDLLYQPNNSLVKQAYDPQMLDALSLAGFGLLAWDDSSRDPHVPFSYRTANVPIFDHNLKALAEKLCVTALLAHVRGVPYSENVTVGEQNLHPFHYKGYGLAMAHNGQLAGFDRMRFALVEHVRPEIARLIRGDTDSEWIYAVLLSQLDDPRRTLSPDEVLQAVDRTLSIIRAVRRQHDISTSSPTNLFISDGRFVVAVRFAFDYGCYDMSDPVPYNNADHKFLGIWYTTGKAYRQQDGEWKMIRGPVEDGRSLLISSEPLTRDASTWLEVPEYSALISTAEDGNQRVRVKHLDV
jgi:glutamine amidotransferase